jgi:hypothetical protein
MFRHSYHLKSDTLKSYIREHRKYIPYNGQCNLGVYLTQTFILVNGGGNFSAWCQILADLQSEIAREIGNIVCHFLHQ